MSKYEKFEVVTLCRNTLRNADYNPRVISGQARARLRKGIEELGVVQPIVWNETTGNIVGGHQRLSILDDLEGCDDYNIQVSRITVSPSVEKRLNVILNNDSAMGHWDESKLVALIQSQQEEAADFAFDDLGFSANEADYYTKLMQDNEVENRAIIEAMSDAIDYEEDIHARSREGEHERHQVKLEKKQAFEQRIDSLLTVQDPSQWKLKTEEERKAYDESREGFRNETFEYVFIKIVFDSLESKKEWLDSHDMPMTDTIHEKDLRKETPDEKHDSADESNNNDDVEA